VYSFQGAICTENSNLGPDDVFLSNISQDVLILQGCYSQVSHTVLALTWFAGKRYFGTDVTRQKKTEVHAAYPKVGLQKSSCSKAEMLDRWNPCPKVA
jgi:hypothetical protein